MNFLILILLFCFLIFLYIIYLLSHEDFVILRADVSMEKIFNAAFLFGISGLFFSRLIYVFSHPNPVFHSFLGFLLFPYFPGLSPIGGLIGGFGFAYLYFKSRNLPLGRLMDFFSMAYLISYPLALIGTLILSRQTLAWPLYISILLSALTVGVFVKYVLPKSLGGKLKDGNLSLIFFSSFSLIYILTNIFIYNFKNVVNVENIFSLIILLSSFTYLVKREGSLKIIPGI